MFDIDSDLLKLVAAMLLGGVIGFEREVRDKPAGFRTMMLIALGAALFTILSVKLAAGRTDPARIAAQIVTGVGFLGAGAIIRDGGSVLGLTTAASIWLVASIGMASGLGEFRIAASGVAVTLVVLLVFSRIEQWVDARRDRHTYTLTFVGSLADTARLRHRAIATGLSVKSLELGRSTAGLRVTVMAVGPRDAHEVLVGALLADPDVTELTRS